MAQRLPSGQNPTSPEVDIPICMAWQQEAAHTHTHQHESVSFRIYHVYRCLQMSTKTAGRCQESQHLLAPWNMATQANTTRRKSILVTEAH